MYNNATFPNIPKHSNIAVQTVSGPDCVQSQESQRTPVGVSSSPAGDSSSSFVLIRKGIISVDTKGVPIMFPHV